MPDRITTTEIATVVPPASLEATARTHTSPKGFFDSVSPAKATEKPLPGTPTPLTPMLPAASVDLINHSAYIGLAESDLKAHLPPSSAEELTALHSLSLSVYQATQNAGNAYAAFTGALEKENKSQTILQKDFETFTRESDAISAENAAKLSRFLDNASLTPSELQKEGEFKQNFYKPLYNQYLSAYDQANNVANYQALAAMPGTTVSGDTATHIWKGAWGSIALTAVKGSTEKPTMVLNNQVSAAAYANWTSHQLQGFSSLLSEINPQLLTPEARVALNRVEQANRRMASSLMALSEKQGNAAAAFVLMSAAILNAVNKENTQISNLSAQLNDQQEQRADDLASSQQNIANIQKEMHGTQKTLHFQVSMEQKIGIAAAACGGASAVAMILSCLLPGAGAAIAGAVAIGTGVAGGALTMTAGAFSIAASHTCDKLGQEFKEMGTQQEEFITAKGEIGLFGQLGSTLQESLSSVLKGIRTTSHAVSAALQSIASSQLKG